MSRYWRKQHRNEQLAVRLHHHRSARLCQPRRTGRRLAFRGNPVQPVQLRGAATHPSSDEAKSGGQFSCIRQREGASYQFRLIIGGMGAAAGAIPAARNRTLSPREERVGRELERGETQSKRLLSPALSSFLHQEDPSPLHLVILSVIKRGVPNDASRYQSTHCP